MRELARPAPSMEEQLVQRGSARARKRKRLEAQVDPLFGNETSSQVGLGRERIVQQGEQQGDVQAQPPREHLPPSEARPATGCATVGHTSWCTTSVSCGCSQLPDLESGANKEAVVGWNVWRGW